MNWFLYDSDLHHEKFNNSEKLFEFPNESTSIQMHLSVCFMKLKKMLSLTSIVKKTEDKGIYNGNEKLK